MPNHSNVPVGCIKLLEPEADPEHQDMFNRYAKVASRMHELVSARERREAAQAREEKRLRSKLASNLQLVEVQHQRRLRKDRYASRRARGRKQKQHDTAFGGLFCRRRATATAQRTRPQVAAAAATTTAPTATTTATLTTTATAGKRSSPPQRHTTQAATQSDTNANTKKTHANTNALKSLQFALQPELRPSPLPLICPDTGAHRHDAPAPTLPGAWEEIAPEEHARRDAELGVAEEPPLGVGTACYYYNPVSGDVRRVPPDGASAECIECFRKTGSALAVAPTVPSMRRRLSVLRRMQQRLRAVAAMREAGKSLD